MEEQQSRWNGSVMRREDCRIASQVEERNTQGKVSTAEQSTHAKK
jgi:hypothetical protein